MSTRHVGSLVHEAYLRLVGGQRFDHRGHFFAAAAEAMRRILVERARRKALPKHGGGRRRIDLNEAHRLRIWDLTAENPSANSRVLSGHQDRVTGVAISPDGRWVFTWSHDKSAGISLVKNGCRCSAPSRTAGRSWICQNREGAIPINGFKLLV